MEGPEQQPLNLLFTEPWRIAAQSASRGPPPPHPPPQQGHTPTFAFYNQVQSSSLTSLWSFLLCHTGFSDWTVALHFFHQHIQTQVVNFMAGREIGERSRIQPSDAEKKLDASVDKTAPLVCDWSQTLKSTFRAAVALFQIDILKYNRLT